MKFHSIDQSTDGWRRLRSGIPTASNFHHIITPEGKQVDSRERNRYKYKLVTERIFNSVIEDDYSNHWMERGVELEDKAAQDLADKFDVPLDSGGFVTTDDGRAGCSPDRLIRTKSNKLEAVEIKVPSPQVHIAHMCEGPGNKYKPQVQGQLMIGEFSCVRFWSWNPDLPPVYIVTLRDDAYIRKLSNLLDLFCREVDAAERFVRKAMHEGLVWSTVGGSDALEEILQADDPLPTWRMK